MLGRIHENPAYQDFLISEQRKGLIPPDLYDALIPQFFDGLQILDFGCGLGYTAAYYAEKFAGYENFHIYACDHQVEVIDALWKRITDNQFKHITVFHMPDRPRLHFPKWVPPVHHLFLSLSLVTTDNPVDILTTLRPMILDEGIIHIIEWDKEKSHRELDTLFPQKHRLSAQQILNYLDQAKYEVIRTYKVGGPYIVMTARPYFGEKPAAATPEKKQPPRPASPVSSAAPINPERAKPPAPTPTPPTPPSPIATPTPESSPSETLESVKSMETLPPVDHEFETDTATEPWPNENPGHEFEADDASALFQESPEPGEHPDHEFKADDPAPPQEGNDEP